MTRNELFYFTTSDLMVRVAIDEHQNKATYHTHRAINIIERERIENYIISEVLSDGDIFKTLEVIELGIDDALLKEYTSFRKSKLSKKSNPNRLELLKTKDKEITAAVTSLCTAANEDMWFNRIGDILRERNEEHAGDEEYKFPELQKAVIEYNKAVVKERQVYIIDLIKKN